MITMPTVQHCFDGVRRNSRSNLPWALRVVSLTGTVVIDCLIVNHPAGAAVMFSHRKHPGTPGGGCVDWYPLDDSKADVTIKASLDLSIPM